MKPLAAGLRGRILLVEDDCNDVELILHSLGRTGLAGSTSVVHDGAEAMEFLHSKTASAGLDMSLRPALVILDLKLPKVSGIELLGSIRSDPRTRLIPVVAFTSSREDRDISACYELRINSYVVKPVEFELFSAAIERIVIYWLNFNQSPPPGAAAPQRAGV